MLLSSSDPIEEIEGIEEMEEIPLLSLGVLLTQLRNEIDEIELTDELQGLLCICKLKRVCSVREYTEGYCNYVQHLELQTL